MDLRATQRAIWANKRAKRFNTTDIPLELCLLQGEVAELFEAWHKKRATVGEELADVAIYLLGLAQMLGIDLETEIARKVSVNHSRRYTERDGVMIKRDSRTADAERSGRPDVHQEALVLPLQI